MPKDKRNEYSRFMGVAYKEAQKALAIDEVPVGACVVIDGKVVARGHNIRQKSGVATRHAEIVAIEKACKKQGNWYLVDAELYVTLEPCPMCMGAVINSRIKKVIFGAYDKKAGCAGTLYNFAEGKFNHTPEVVGGVEEEKCGAILTDFFRSKRELAKEKKN